MKFQRASVNRVFDGEIDSIINPLDTKYEYMMIYRNSAD